MRLLIAPLALAALALAAPAQAQQAGDWTFSVGLHAVSPKSGNGSLAGGTLDADVGDDWRPTITAEYFLSDKLGIEVLAALPFEHDVRLNGAKAGSTKHLPPTVSLQYHFRNDSKVTPFIGAGVNYTRFFDEKTTGALDGTRLSLDPSWGLAAHAGVDFAIGENKAIRIDARYIDIDTDVKVNGAKVGTVNIDPTVYGAAFVWSF
ncbi:OmpW/AlkL family protein [Arenimonas caeni]|jgi:outer membrane protein|uniref:OmpW/AlkL family protein n=1 Tax=Arenimonas caeni TaxID=2058085 RepID=UPI002A3693DA|nr:OmpW family outer membrane protein [Arenimonas caeni]MDY0022441.1 OmpW family outer membrane protein [Arenimonas caeni]